MPAMRRRAQTQLFMRPPPMKLHQSLFPSPLDLYVRALDLKLQYSRFPRSRGLAKRLQCIAGRSLALRLQACGYRARRLIELGGLTWRIGHRPKFKKNVVNEDCPVGRRWQGRGRLDRVYQRELPLRSPVAVE